MFWVAPQDSNLSYDAFAKWNQMYPTAPHAIVHRAVEWPLLDFSATPVFYFFRDGVIQEKVTGWPPDGEGKINFVRVLDRVAKAQ